MSALGNAFRKLMGSGGGPTGGLVLAARHFAQVDATWSRGEPIPRRVLPEDHHKPSSTATTHEEAAVERPDLANWDLPPGLASVVEAERATQGPDPGQTVQTKTGQAARRDDAVAFEFAGDMPQRAMDSQEMESLLARLAD